MSISPWGTLDLWLRLEVEQRAIKAQRRLTAQNARAARRTQTEPVLRATPQAVPATRPTISQADCTEAA
jgi:hypothetical protein